MRARTTFVARTRTTFATTLAAGVIIAALGVALATTTARAHCEDAVKAPAAPADDPASELVQAVWARVYGGFGALTGRATELVVLDASAKKADGSPFPPSAFVCPSKSATETPRMYVTWPLIQKAQADKLYDVDFIALVIGHELGHRARDLTFEGMRQTKEGGPSIEARADAHGAFFAAIAGYSTRRLACDAALDTFLDVEAHVGASVRAERRKQLASALMAFDVYESLYEATAGLAFWDSKTARGLLTWVDQRLGADFTPIPEFKVLLALTILMDVAADAPWTKLTAVPGAPNNHLRCVPVYPQHTALWDEIIASDEGTQASRDLATDLKMAIGLLNDALGLGASPLAAQSSLSCAWAYMGDTKKAKAALEQAQAAAKGRPEALQKALAQNGAFIAWVDWMGKSKVPDAKAADADKKKWADALKKERASWSANPGITAWVEGLASWPASVPAKNKVPAPSCGGEAPKTAPGGSGQPLSERPSLGGWSRLPTCPDKPKAGGCPCGWLELHQLGDPLSKDDPNDGVRTCVPSGWGTGLRWVDVDLPLPDIRARLMLIDTIDSAGALASVRTWEKRCDAFEMRGTGDRGQVVYTGLCPQLGAPQVVLQADACRVMRAVVVAP